MRKTDRHSAERKSDSAPPSGPGTQSGIFVSSGEYWTIGHGGKSFSLKGVKGLSYIQRLLRHPHDEFHVLDLLNEPGTGTNSGITVTDISSVLRDSGVSIGRLGDAGEILDAEAKQNYRRKLLELREELADLRDRGNVDRAEKVQADIDFVAHEIARAVGLGGRSRRAGSAAERARLNVTRAIKVALQKVSEHDPYLGELLDRSIKRGSFCSYAPHPRTPVSWQFSLESPQASVEGDPTIPVFLRSDTRFLRTFTERTTFVGREVERAILRKFLEQTRRGQGKVVLIGGAPGVGKTRIGTEIGAEASSKGFLTFVGGCYDREDSVPFIPFIEILEAALAQARSPEIFREVLGSDAPELARLLPQLRRLFPDIAPPLELPPEQSRRMLFNAVAQLVTRTASQRPVLLLLDDLHWADEGTLLLLNYLSPLIAKIPVLVLGTYRDFELQLTRPLAKTLDEMIRLHLVERITLDGLPQSAVAEMLRMLNGSEPPESLTALFYSETEGNPFFVEELYSHLVEQGKLIDSAGEFRCDLKLDDIDVPQSLRLVIGRRLARLSDAAQKTLGTAAVIGRSFTFDVLEASTPSNADSLLDCIEEAERAGLILSTVDYPDARFMFSHELIRQTVESGLSAPRRRRLHLDVANAIEHVYSNALVEHAEDLAHHLWRAGAIAEAEKTVRYLAMAARQASTRSANLEAIAHLTKGLDVLRALPDSSQRSQQELAFQVNLGMSLTSAKGYSAPDVRRAYARARDLCEQLGETPQLYPVLWGLWAYYLVSGDYKASHEIGQNFLTLAEQQNDTDLLLEAHTSEGLNFFYGGCDLDSARMHFESALSLYDPETHRGHALLYVQDPAIVTRSVLAWILWLQGYPEQALATHRECLRRAREQSHSYSLAYALAHGGTLCQFRRDIQLGRELAEQGITLSSEQGFSYFLLAAKYTLGWALNQLSQAEEAITILRDATNASHAIGAQATRPHQLGLLAEALARANRAEEGLAVLSDALVEVRSTREEYYEAELHRLRGELFLIQPRPNEDRAAAAFLQSLEVARHQHAKSWELRAATSLFRLKLKQGSSEQARQTLASIYGWFTEGFDTPDLQDAEALLRMSRAI